MTEKQNMAYIPIGVAEEFRNEIQALREENERLRKASKEGLFNLTKAHEVARMVDIRLNPENSVNKEDFLNHISEGYLFNQSTISLLDDAKAALQSVQGKTCKGCLRFKSDNPLESCTSKDEDNWCGGWTSKQEVAL